MIKTKAEGAVARVTLKSRLESAACLRRDALAEAAEADARASRAARILIALQSAELTESAFWAEMEKIK